MGQTLANALHGNGVMKNIFISQNSVSVLAVDDDDLSMRFMEAQIAELGHRMIQAKNGEQAIAALKSGKRSIDVVLMDKEMPVMDGLSAIKRIKDDPELRHIPVIMVTGADSMDEMRQGLDAGVFYYLTKPVQGEMLRSVLSAAVREAEQTRILQEELHKHKTSFDLVETCKFRFQTIQEAESLAAFMANCFPKPERVVGGLGEILINAIEHGNLGIGYTRKTELVDSGIWRAEIEKLQKSSAHRDKYAEATIAHKPDGVYVVIKDMGTGFDWKKYMKIDPSRAGDNHGRGIAQANTVSFDRLIYNDTGNQAIAFVGNAKQLEW